MESLDFDFVSTLNLSSYTAAQFGDQLPLNLQPQPEVPPTIDLALERRRRQGMPSNTAISKSVVDDDDDC